MSNTSLTVDLPKNDGTFSEERGYNGSDTSRFALVEPRSEEEDMSLRSDDSSGLLPTETASPEPARFALSRPASTGLLRGSYVLRDCGRHPLLWRNLPSPRGE